MIAVIADDFTGAAEIGGVALRHGLKVVIETTVNSIRDVDIVVVATNTRSMSEKEAVSEVCRIVKELNKLNPDYIFKKLDSVLRGHVIAELEAHMETLGIKRALVVAGNPEFGRLIRNGVYYIDSVPLDQTFFANDPDFPRKVSNVLALVGQETRGAYSLKLEKAFPDGGIVFGDVSNEAEMMGWSAKVDRSLVPAGGSGFFNALLTKGDRSPRTKLKRFEQTGNRALFVFGSAYPKSSIVNERLQASGIRLLHMPDSVYWNNDANGNELQVWFNDVIAALNAGLRVAVATPFMDSQEVGLSYRIQRVYASLVAEIIGKVALSDLLIEGGATASTVLSALGICKLYPYREIDSGVIQMKTDVYPGLCLTTKPGSYLWPDHFFE
jgi:uncharacterized protein YgbK (DUF1537 family)